MLDRGEGGGRWRVLCECVCMGIGHKSLTESARSIGAEVNPTCWSKSNYKRIRHTSTTLCFRNTTAYPLPQTHSPARPAQSWIDRHKPRASFRRPSDALNSTREIANCPACGLLKLSLSLSLTLSMGFAYGLCGARLLLAGLDNLIRRICRRKEVRKQ